MEDVTNYINQLSIDCVIFGYEDRQLKVLLLKLNYNGDFYSLPSGYIFQNEDIELAAKRVVRERTGICEDINLQHFNVFGNVNRKRKEFLEKLIELNFANKENEQKNSPTYQWFTNRFITIGYYSLVNIKNVVPTLVTKKDAAIEWFNINEVPELIMDYNQVLTDAYQNLQANIDKSQSIFNLLPEQFTMKELLDIYETILEKTFVSTNFQKKMLDLGILERLEKKYTGAKNKAPYLYKLKNNDLTLSYKN